MLIFKNILLFFLKIVRKLIEISIHAIIFMKIIKFFVYNLIGLSICEFQFYKWFAQKRKLNFVQIFMIRVSLFIIPFNRISLLHSINS
jgi:hypothetical protein